MRKKRYIYSMLASLISQLVSVICGIVLPRVLIGQYGSELYGATTSILQFLGYIALLEGGIGGVARAALYKPLAEKDSERINEIIVYIQKFFRIIAAVFCIYTLVIASTYKYIAKDNTFEWGFNFILVVVIALSSLAQYYFGIAYTVLLQADQRTYVTLFLGSITMLLNTVLACFLAYQGIGMIGLKLVWCFVHLIRIGILNLYISKNYHLKKVKVTRDYLPEKWDGLGQHIAYFLHSHTDVMVLTLFVNLTEVSVYSVYNYIATSLNTFILAFTANFEAVFGDMLARNENEKLNYFFDYMEFVVNFVVSMFFPVAFTMILPFISIYTAGIKDANYYRPLLGMVMLATQVVYLMRVPYHELTIAAGHFKKTRNASFVEAGLNISLSCIFSVLWGTEGVILATLLSISYRGIFYVNYLKKEIIYRSPIKFVKRFCVTALNLLVGATVLYEIGKFIGEISSWLQWFMVAIFYIILAFVVTCFVSFVFYRKDFNELFVQGREILKRFGNVK